jgi:hypothetical protein
MKLRADQARALLTTHHHGVLCTVHEALGADAVPSVYAIDDHGFVGIPVDTVKPKASSRLLQREKNLRADPRATLLVENWNRDDWSRLWWVRAELRWRDDAGAQRAAGLGALLAAAFPQYRDEPFTRVLALQVLAVTGWAATPPESSPET